MKNVTVSLDDDTHRRARLRAAEAGRSLSALVRDFLRSLGDQKSEEERRRERLVELFAEFDASGTRFSAASHLSRDELYDEMLNERSR